MTDPASTAELLSEILKRLDHLDEALKSIQTGPDALVRRGPAARMIGVGPKTLDKIAESDPSFPSKIFLSRRAVGFRREALLRWMRERDGSAA